MAAAAPNGRFKNRLGSRHHWIPGQLMCTVDDLKEMGIPLGPRKKIAKYMEEMAARKVERKATAEKKTFQAQPEKSDGFTTNSNLEPEKRKLPVGASVSSIHVNYEHFETGTGQ
ncbi:hypothetical protein AB205_0001340, partial [Aquarana catesbeiana]